MQAQALARALAPLTKMPQFSYQKARAAARADGNVDWAKTKRLNADFNAEVDGSVCQWNPARFTYAARGPEAS